MREPGDAASHDKADASGRWAGERLAASGADTVTLCGHLRALELTLNATALQNVLVGMLRGMADGARQALQRAMLSLTAVPAPATQAIGWPELFEVAAESYWVAQPRRLGSADLAIDALTEDDLDACFEGLVEYVAANTTSGHGLSQICAALRRAAVYQLRLRLDAALAAREAALRAQVVAALGDRFPNRETLDAALTAAGMDDPKERGPILDRCADERLPRVFREALKAVTTQPGPHWTPEGQALTVAAACVGLGLDAYANQPSVVARAFADALSAVAHTCACQTPSIR